MYDIVIIGAGWYGCHIANILQNKYKILIIERKEDIFCCSSYYNQNRLHLGFHYPRDYNTRTLCSSYYKKFKELYSDCIEEVEDNYYVISKFSLLCDRTYTSIFSHERIDFMVERIHNFINIQGLPFKVEEKVINAEKAKRIMKENLLNCDFSFGENVDIILETEIDILVNGKYKCKYLFNCTYNQLSLDDNIYNYELTLSLLYKKTGFFGALTVVDGDFCSLYPRETNIYTLTDVEFTPLFKSSSFEEVKNFIPSQDLINNRKNKMEEKIKFYYPDFENNFEYQSYFLSYKTKMISSSDSRDITITNLNSRIISVNCGKIYGIFEWEKYILNFLKSAEECDEV